MNKKVFSRNTPSSAGVKSASGGRIIQINLNNKNDSKALKEQVDIVVDYLKRGKVIVYPTDTIYGIGCMATDQKAIDKIYKIKKRDKKKPLLILVNSYAMLKKYCYVSKKQGEYLKKIWPGPVTVILKNKNNLPANLTHEKSELAVRLPNSQLLRKIIKEAMAPLVSTSLNISGEGNLTDVGNVSHYFKNNFPDLIVDAGRIEGKPSKLINLVDINNIIIIRK